jgi:hypothetical protein
MCVRCCYPPDSNHCLVTAEVVENAGGMWCCMTGCRWRTGGNGGGVSFEIDVYADISNVLMSLSIVNATGNTAAGAGARHMCALLLFC